jgi:superfamily II DNA or RNA helicase
LSQSLSSGFPQPGMLATLRNRRALVTSVDDFSGAGGEVSRLVGVEYMDAQSPAEDYLLWEHEPGAELVEPRRLPAIDRELPMRPHDFEAVQRSARWLALSPFIGAEGLPIDASPIASPLFGAIQVEDYQLLPLARALRMPRVSLALFDDVGLGKSVEAGLILSELILRRRLRRILILCPAWLRHQWREEMRSKFSLTFDVVDRPEAHQLRRRLGMDVNPWRTHQRIIASYHYLKQPDVLADFLAVCQGQHSGSATLPWDLIIVDEAHNCMPSAIQGADSNLYGMLRRITPHFEHRLFLTATPHNGYTHSFLGLLELLDPVRFTRKDEMTAAERRRAEEIVIRRLKTEINKHDEAAGRTPRFVDREIIPRPLYFGKAETALARALENFRKAVKLIFGQGSRSEQTAANFALEVLSKRLLSCPYAFADSWWRLKDGLAQDETASDGEIRSAERAIREELDDDAEAESRLSFASRVSGAWLRRFEDRLGTYITAIDERLTELGLTRDSAGVVADPDEDARFDQLVHLIKERLREGKTWSNDERLIVFTEYKTTLSYLILRLRAAFPNEPEERFRFLYGGMDDAEREEIKRAFNDPKDPVRILIGTDAASEGANLQETARLLLHYDVPWNPSRLDQRNGRLDRHGQARDVHVFHFTSEQDADLRFLGKIIKKVDQIRTDLGSMNELFDVAFRQRLIDLRDEQDVFAQLEIATGKVQKRKKQDVPVTMVSGDKDQKALEWIVRELDYSPEGLRRLVEIAMGMQTGGFTFNGPDGRGCYRFPAVPERWRPVVDADVRFASKRGEAGALPALLFDPQQAIQSRSGRAIFRPAKDSILMHLGHPLVRQSLLHLSRARFPGTEEARSSSRWIVRCGPVPAGCDALILVTVEELAVNDLREAFHQWVRTLRFPMIAGRIGEALPHIPAAEDHADLATCESGQIERARLIWAEAEEDIREALQRRGEALTQAIQARLAKDLEDERKTQEGLFRERRAELDKQLSRQIKELEKEMTKLVDDVDQDDLFRDTDFFRGISQIASDIESERQRRQRHHEEMKTFLAEEERRIIDQLLPRRHALRGEAQVFPVTVEIRFLSQPADGGEC